MRIKAVILILTFLFPLLAQENDPESKKKYSQTTTSEDDAFAILDKGEIMNTLGNQGAISDGYYQNLIYNFRWPKSKGVAEEDGANACDDIAVIFGHKGNVLDAYSRYRNEDWQAPPGALGKYHADDQPDNLTAPDGAPRLAHSDIPITWPKGFFDKNNIWIPAPTGNYESLSDADKELVDSKGAFYDADKNVWRFWPGKFRTDVDPDSPTYREELPGQFAADREVYAIMTDHNAQLPSTPIGLTLEMQAYSYGRRFAQDIQFYDIILTNNSNQSLDSCWFGYYVDFQFGDSGDEVWGSFSTPKNPTQNDNAFYQYDFNGPDPGNIEEGYMGAAILGTPKDLGVTDAHFFLDASGSVTPADDAQMWPVMTSDPNDPNIIASNYFHGPNVKFDDFSLTEPGQQPGVSNWTMYVTSGPFTLEPGESCISTIVIGFGKDLDDLKSNFVVGEELFLNDFVGPAAPPSPDLNAVAGDRRVALFWDDKALNAVDPSSKKKDFEGYKIYRSQDQGATWGKEITDNQGNLVGYVPIAQFDKDNLVQGIDPINNYNFLGNNTGIRHSFIDSTVINGVNYSYTITSYDSGSVSKEIESLESARGTTAADNNLVDVTPRSNPIGYNSASYQIEQISLSGNGNIIVTIINPSDIAADEYMITFNESPADSFYFSKRGSNEVLAKVPLGSNIMVPVDGLFLNVQGDESTGEIVSITDGNNNNVFGKENVHPDYNWYIKSLTNNALGDLYTKGSDYQFRFTENGSYTSNLAGNNKPMIKNFQVPFEVWNVSLKNNQFQINTIILDNNRNQQYDAGEEIRIINEPYIENKDTLGIFSLLKWYQTISIDTVGSDAVLPSTGDIFTIKSTCQLSAQDTFVVHVELPSVNTSRDVQESALSEVRVVPNPFVVNAAWEQLENNRRLRFMFLPPECTIKIFTVRGELVKEIYHNNNSGDEDWNLTNLSGNEVAYGLYLYYISTPSGATSIGKFAIIK